MASGIPIGLARRDNRVLRPRDAGAVYAYPRAELARLARRGVVTRLAIGYYALVPQDRIGDHSWNPELESAALGVAQADYGRPTVALMGVSAARHHGAIPRALAVAIVAIPKQRPTLRTIVGSVVFVRRDIAHLDTERIDTPLTSGWVTTIEQTLLDLAGRPTLGGLSPSDLAESVRALGRAADWSRVERLAHDQHRPAALHTATRLAGRDRA